MDLERFFVKHDMLYAAIHKNSTVFGILHSIYGCDVSRDQINFHVKHKEGSHNWKTAKMRGFRMRLDAGSEQDLTYLYMSSRGLLYEPKTSDLIMGNIVDSVRKNKAFIFVDVGASYGWFTLLAASLMKKLSAQGLVISFEPSPSNFDRLADNVKLNRLRKVEMHRLALGGKRTKAALNISGKSDGENSLLKIDDVKNSVSVQVDTLDNVLKGRRASLIKMDVEGIEEEVLIGARKTLSNNDVRLVIEYNHATLYRNKMDYDSIFRRLTSMGFTIKEINDRHNAMYESQVKSHKDLHSLVTNLYCYRE